MGNSGKCKDNIIDYLQKNGEVTFSERKFNEVDGLILSQFSYFKFAGIIPMVKDAEESIVLRKILLKKNWKQLFRDERYLEDNRELFRLLLRSKRFGNIKLNYHMDVVDEERELQFSAITFLPDNGPAVIAFRGTDENIIGWKENFNMIYRTPVPAQEYAAVYVNQVASLLKEKIVLCGHSKGGNLAVFAAAKCVGGAQEKILQVYNYDGPGFRNSFLLNAEYQKILPKVKKYVTRESLVGQLLFSDEKTIPVSNCAKGIKQHYVFNWKVKGFHFIRESREIKKKDEIGIFNRKISEMSLREAQLAIDTVFALLKASEADTVQELSDERLYRAVTVLSAARNLDRETIKLLKEAISMIAFSD